MRWLPFTLPVAPFRLVRIGSPIGSISHSPCKSDPGISQVFQISLSLSLSPWQVTRWSTAAVINLTHSDTKTPRVWVWDWMGLFLETPPPPPWLGFHVGGQKGAGKKVQITSLMCRPSESCNIVATGQHLGGCPSFALMDPPAPQLPSLPAGWGSQFPPPRLAIKMPDWVLPLSLFLSLDLAPSSSSLLLLLPALCSCSLLLLICLFSSVVWPANKKRKRVCRALKFLERSSSMG